MSVLGGAQTAHGPIDVDAIPARRDRQLGKKGVVQRQVEAGRRTFDEQHAAPGAQDGEPQLLGQFGGLREYLKIPGLGLVLHPGAGARHQHAGARILDGQEQLMSGDDERAVLPLLEQGGEERGDDGAVQVTLRLIDE